FTSNTKLRTLIKHEGTHQVIQRIALLLAGLALALPVMGQTTLNGAGATFPYPMYSKWFSEYNKLHSDVQINYQSIGSGGGIRQVLNGTVDFGASDGPMSDEQLAQSKTKILHVPTVLGAVVPAYNVPGISEDWSNSVGKGTSVKWPVGMGGKGNEGVAGQIRQLQGSIGYVELVYAVENKITYGSVKNAAGNFVKASLDSVTEAAASVKTMPADFRVSIT